MNMLKTIIKGSMIVGALAMSFPTLAGNEDRIGSAGASEMLVNPWARSTAFGSAGVASTNGLEAQFSNIAGLAFTDKTQIKFNYTNWLGDANISLNSAGIAQRDRKSTRLNSSHVRISYAVFCLKKKKINRYD